MLTTCRSKEWRGEGGLLRARTRHALPSRAPLSRPTPPPSSFWILDATSASSSHHAAARTRTELRRWPKAAAVLSLPRPPSTAALAVSPTAPDPLPLPWRTPAPCPLAPSCLRHLDSCRRSPACKQRREKKKAREGRESEREKIRREKEREKNGGTGTYKGVNSEIW